MSEGYGPFYPGVANPPQAPKPISEGNWGESSRALWDALSRSLMTGVEVGGDVLEAGDVGTDYAGALAYILGASPDTTALISNPADYAKARLSELPMIQRASEVGRRFGAASAGFPGVQFRDPAAAGPVPPVNPEVMTPPFVPPPVGASGGGFSIQTGRGFESNPINYEEPEAPNYSEAEGMLRAVEAGTRPTAPSKWDLTMASLAGFAGGAAGGDSVGEILARAGAQGYATRSAKQDAYDQALRQFEDRYAKLEMDRANSLANIKSAEATFRQAVAGDALRADIANANQQIAMMQLNRPQADVVGGYLVVNQWDPRTGKMGVQRYLVNPLIEEIAFLAAQNRGRSSNQMDTLTYPLPGGGQWAIKDPALQAHIARSVFELTSKPDDPRTKAAISIAAQSAFAGAEDPLEEAESLRLRDPDAYNKLVIGPAAIILLSDGINEGREIPEE